MNDESLFAAALDQPDRAARGAFLDQHCDPEQRERLDRLLAAHDRAGSFLNQPPTGVHDQAATRTFGEPEDDDIGDALGFLQPSTRPGSLGRIQHYEMLEVLGRGGFGIVFRAFDETLQRVVAIKVLRPSFAATSPARKRFLREAQASAGLTHDNIVKVHFTGDAPLPFLVMEFIAGETLQQRLDRTGPLDPREVVGIGRQIAEGLAAAHEKGLVHRDIKPANVLVDGGPQGRVKLTDFGLARAADDASLSQSGVVAGTPMYMAPEQARGDTLDHRADLFSLGSVLYALLTGRPPFRAESALAVLKRVVDDAPRPIREVIPEVPEWLCRIVEKLHAKNPAERYQTARAVADVLADCESQLQSSNGLRDYSRIPEKKRAAKSSGAWRWVAAGCLILALIPLGMVSLYMLLATTSDHIERPALATGTLSLKLNNTAVEFRIDGHGANQTAVSNLQTPLDAGLHHIWFKHNGRAWKTDPFMILSGQTTTVEIEVKEFAAEVHVDGRLLDLIPDEPAGDGWFPLFNTVSFQGWNVDRAQYWSVENGTLVQRTPATAVKRFSPISSQRSFRDFHVRLEAKVNAAGDTGLLLRGGQPKGVQVQMLAGRELGNIMRAGWTLKAAKPVAVSPDQWFRLDAFVVGPRILVQINGEVVNDWTDPESASEAGWIGLEAGNPGTVASFRNVEVRAIAAIPQSDRELLQGRWVGVSAESQGQPLTAARARSMKLEFNESQLTVTEAGKPPQTGTFKLDAEANPKEIDAIRNADEKGMRGIYRLEGDTLTIAMGEPGPARPKEFKTTKDAGTLLVAILRRAKPFDPEVRKSLQTIVETQKQLSDTARRRYEAGVTSQAEYLQTLVELTRAQANLAEAEDDPSSFVARLEELVTHHEAVVKLMDARFKAAIVTRDEVLQAEAKLAESKALLAKAKAGAKP